MTRILLTYILATLPLSLGGLSAQTSGDALGAAVMVGTPAVERPNLDLAQIRKLPVQDNQRYGPLDTFARKSVREVTGKEKFHKTDPVLLLLSWRADPVGALEGRYLKLPNVEAAEHYGLEVPSQEITHTSWARVAQVKGFLAAVREVRQKLMDEEVLSANESELWTFWQRFAKLSELLGVRPGDHTPRPMPLGGFLPVVPPVEAPKPAVEYVYGSPYQIDQLGWPRELAQGLENQFSALSDSFRADDGPAFAAASSGILASIAQMNPEKDSHYRGLALMEREVRLNKLNPFSTLRYIYFMVFFLALIALPFRRSLIVWALPVLGLVAALSYHGWALVERTIISERAMIGNLYESAIFVAAGAALFGLIFELIFRRGWFVVAGSVLAMLGLFWSQSNPEFWQPEISKLQPVLINNSLIHIHVPTIMLSYAALALTVILGHIYLFLWWFTGSRKPSQEPEELKHVAKYMVWTIPVGVTILFAGIILGGVWADASWGRFWGWDPKETASLITWLVFMVIIHGRWAGWLRNVGTAVGTQVGGLALLWTYWGANFYQSGLHSYAGSGTQAPTWPWYYLGFEALVVAITLVMWMKRGHAESEPQGDAAPPVGPRDALYDH